MRNEPMETVERTDGSITKIYYDEDPHEGPREWDNLGTMVCSHRRYNLGDVQLKDESFLQHIDQKFEVLDDDDAYYDDSERSEKLLNNWIEKNLICLNLYLYDHSGITMNTSGFSCPWDSGQVGVIYITRKKVREEYSWKKITKERESKIIEYLKGEVKTYDQYLTGDMYGFVTEMPDKCDSCEHVENKHVDSCWGFYGSDFKENGLFDHAGITPEEAQAAGI